VSRVVLFGGNGFIGSAIGAGIDGVVAPPRSEVDLVDDRSVRRFLRSGDLVINAAGYARATDRSSAGAERFRRENVRAVEVLADEAARAGVDQLIHISSVAAMGHREGSSLTEEMLAAPRSPYGVSKRDAEVALARHADDIPITILRPTSVFGEGRPLAVALCRIASLPLVPLPDGGRALVPFTYVDNVVAGVRLAIGCKACHGGTFIVGDERSYRLREIVEGLARGMGNAAFRALPVPAWVLRVAAGAERRVRVPERAPLLDPTRIETLTRSISYSVGAFQGATGYRPPIGLDEATRRIGAWYVHHRDG
jgi:nucleoside-diphosphate-sugar epimerase